ncbi:hypothetical protein CRYUN_Cryun25bG0070300 [Craigia yunnanensis]
MERFVLLLVAAVSMGMTNVTMGQENSSSNHVSAMYMLGDSSVDCGVNSLFYPIVHQDLSLFPCNGSNSILLPYLLAEKMGLPYTVPFYSQNGSIEGLLSGVNYGAAQATILSPSSLSHQSLNQQLRQVFETLQLLELQLGQESSYHFVRSSLFYLSFGKDDYIDLFLQNFSGCMHGNITFGCTPSLLLEWHSPTARGNIDDGTGCAEEINELVLQYNTMLEEHIVRLNEELPDAHIVFCDLYQGVKKIITHPKLFGFEDAKSACCGLGFYGAKIGCISSDMACKTVSAHVWWDLYNPTPEVNSLLADSAWSGEVVLSNLCRPITVQDLVCTSVSNFT